MRRGLSSVGAVLFVLSCLRPSEVRVEEDLAVGRADGAGLSVRVDAGLAVVRELSESQLVLWGSAPGFTLRLGSDAERELDIEIRTACPKPS